MKKKFAAVIVLVCFVMAITGALFASGTQESVSESQSTEDNNLIQTQPETRVVTDMRGRNVEIPVNIDRLASVFPYITFLSLALGGDDILSGIDSASAGNVNLMKTYPGMKSLPAVGMFFNVNPESILEADPQVVLTVNWAREPDKTQELIDVPVICLDMNLYKESIEFLSGILGGEAEARGSELISYYEQKKQFISDSVKSAGTVAARVYIAGGEGMHSTFGKESTWQYEIDDACGINVAADVAGGGSQEVSSEQILLWAPEVIILDSSCPDSVEDVVNDEVFAELPAVKTGRIYCAPKGFLDTFGRPHMESALARLWLAEKLYPEAIDVDVADEAKGFYSKFYGAELSDSEIDEILNPVK